MNTTENEVGVTEDPAPPPETIGIADILAWILGASACFAVFDFWGYLSSSWEQFPAKTVFSGLNYFVWVCSVSGLVVFLRRWIMKWQPRTEGQSLSF